MLFHGFYNLEHVGDILLARLGEGKTFSYDKHDDLVVLKDQKNNVIGYNLLNASSHLGKINDGLVDFNDDQIEKFNQILSKYDLQTVTIDRNPKFIVGKVVEIEDHPDSDHLHICLHPAFPVCTVCGGKGGSGVQVRQLWCSRRHLRDGRLDDG